MALFLWRLRRETAGSRHHRSVHACRHTRELKHASTSTIDREKIFRAQREDSTVCNGTAGADTHSISNDNSRVKTQTAAKPTAALTRKGTFQRALSSPRRAGRRRCRDQQRLRQVQPCSRMMRECWLQCPPKKKYLRRRWSMRQVRERSDNATECAPGHTKKCGDSPRRNAETLLPLFRKNFRMCAWIR